jgi:toxin ParE1/3/4
MTPARFVSAANEEIVAAFEFYEKESEEAAYRFLTEVEMGVELLNEFPRIGGPHIHGSRKFTLDRFSYAVIYLDNPDGVVIIAVAHQSRQPDYWQDRLH